MGLPCQIHSNSTLTSPRCAGKVLPLIASHKRIGTPVDLKPWFSEEILRLLEDLLFEGSRSFTPHHTHPYFSNFRRTFLR